MMDEAEWSGHIWNGRKVTSNTQWWAQQSGGKPIMVLGEPKTLRCIHNKPLDAKCRECDD